MPSAKILCSDCAKEKKNKEKLGYTVTCTPIAAEPGFCQLTWTFGAAKSAGKDTPAEK